MAPSSVRDASKVGIYRTSKSQVFVEIPPSPLFNKARFATQPPKVDKLVNQNEVHKENVVPLSSKTSANNLVIDAKDNAKRKFQDDDNAQKANLKKTKIPKAEGDNLVICHQCRSKKKSPDAILQCTSLMKTGKRCNAAYCDTCLKIRYGEQLKVISQRKPPQSHEGHDPNTSYQFTCPRCSDDCNCAPCRKKKGLAPVGRFASAKEGQSVRAILAKDPQASGSLPKNTVAPGSLSSKRTTINAVAGTAKRPKETTDRVKKTKIKEVPEPKWRPFNQMLTRKEVEDRIYLREFILRFNPILRISHRNVEELDDFTSLHDQSTKAVLIALLDIIAVEDDSQKKTIQGKVKQMRSLGLNWTKIIPLIYELRDSLPDRHALRSLPDLEQSGLEAVYDTREMRTQGLHADQLLPVLLYLVDVASVGESVRLELEEGVKQGKEIRAAYQRAQREETERWATQRTELLEQKQEFKKQGLVMDAFKAKYREAESKHKATAIDIQNSYKPGMDMCSPRFMALGIDMDGRSYYALSASGPQRGKKERLPSDGERCKKWGWFISVWGKPGTVVHEEDATDEDENETDTNADRWWRFAEIQDMRDLGKWLAYRAETDNFGDEPTATTSVSNDETPHTNATLDTFASRLSTARSLSPLTDTESDHGMDVDSNNDASSQPKPARAAIKTLAKVVLDFADFVEWRAMDDERRIK